MSDITKIKVDGEPESSYQLYPRNEEFAKRSEGAQPDWNQNDNTKPDYVKNRPFYAEDPVETVLLEEQAVTFTDGESDPSFNFNASPEDINHIKVTWDGTEYICIPQIHSDYIEFGNKFIDDNTCKDTGEPFCYDGDGEVFYTDSSADSHQIKVSKLSNKVIKIEPNYIPNSNIRNGTGRFSIEEGYNTTASSDYSHAEGYYTTASGVSSHAEGYSIKASGNYSHAEGDFTTASGSSSHAEGSGTTASGISSHAEGYYTTASSDYSHAEGYFTTASGVSSHAEGYGIKASGNYSHAEGKFNIEDIANKYAHIIGNGVELNRHNCFMVGWDGAIYVQASDDATKMMKLTIKSDGTISAEQVTV